MEKPRSEDRPAASTRTLELIVAGILFLFGVMVAADSARVGAEWAEDGPQAGYFPFYIGLLLCVAAVVVFLSALRNTPLAVKVFVWRGQLRLILAMLVPLLVYVVLIRGIEIGPLDWDGLGIYVASTLFLGFFMLCLGRYSLLRTLPIAIGVSFALFLLSVVRFKVPLPKGPLEAWFGWG